MNIHVYVLKSTPPTFLNRCTVTIVPVLNSALSAISSPWLKPEFVVQCCSYHHRILMKFHR